MAIPHFIKKHWSALLSYSIALVSILIMLIIYSKSLATREPVFIVDPVRTEIISAERVSAAPLKVLRASGEPILGDITSVKLYFWNHGRLSIKPEHILEDLKISLDDSKGEILDSKILRPSRQVVSPILEESSTDSLREFTLSFKILEENDGFSIQVIYAGDPSAPFRISGNIEGVRTDIGAAPAITARFWSVYSENVIKVGGAIVFLIIMILFIAGFGMLGEFLQKKLGDRYKIVGICLEIAPHILI